MNSQFIKVKTIYGTIAYILKSEICIIQQDEIKKNESRVTIKNRKEIETKHPIEEILGMVGDINNE